MTTDAATLSKRVKNILDRFGVPGTLHCGGTSSYLAATGSVTTSSEQALAVTVSPPENYDERYIDGQTVNAGDAVCWLAAEGVSQSVQLGQRLDAMGATWRIVSVSPVQLGQTAIAYKLQVRK